MSTLLLRLAAPMQSWGAESKFDTRGTNREPTKSGVVGLLCAALGIRRDDTKAISRLASIKFGVRVDKEGKMLNDFQMVHAIKASYVTHRYYLCDAVFLCGFESEDTKTLSELAGAISHPAYPLFLGRRSCPPTMPLVIGIRDTDLETSLKTEPPLCEDVSPTRIVIDADLSDPYAAVVKDVPVSFSPFKREFAYRKIREIILPVIKPTEHDPFAEVEAENVSDENRA